MKDKDRINNFITEAFQIQEEEANESGALGYMARCLVQATMPHSKVEGVFYERVNGNFTLNMTAGTSKIGLPYGSIPRLLMAWITTEAVKTKNRELVLGESLSGFLRELGLIPSGGRWGTVTRVKEQMKRLFSCSISVVYDDNEGFAFKRMEPVEKAILWWDPKKPEQSTIFNSTLLLREEFFKEIIDNPIVYRMGALKTLKQSSMAVDIYIWTTYRNSYAKKPSRIPWEALQLQFGAGYPLTSQGKRNFKKKFIQSLERVSLVYPDAGKLRTDHEDYLLFIPGKPDIPKILIPT